MQIGSKSYLFFIFDETFCYDLKGHKNRLKGQIGCLEHDQKGLNDSRIN